LEKYFSGIVFMCLNELDGRILCIDEDSYSFVGTNANLKSSEIDAKRKDRERNTLGDCLGDVVAHECVAQSVDNAHQLLTVSSGE
jgi:hypothetical protein